MLCSNVCGLFFMDSDQVLVNNIFKMWSKENEPRFINGLKMAKNILMQLKAQKMEEMQQQESRRTTPLKDLTHR